MKSVSFTRVTASFALAGALALGVVGCSTTPASTESGAPSASSESSTQEQSSSISIQDAWVKAAESGMSAAFGVLVNDSGEDIRVVSATSDASPIMELHETVENADGNMVMREKDGGFVIPANSEYVLQPGANHLMLMDVVDPVLAGSTVSFALELEDGSVFEFEAPAKDYTGANETYVDE
ncbi:MAG: copper chaperone PCu(A)C [Micrococcaceae bacterium]